MKQVSIRMPENMAERLEKEAEAAEMGMAEYVRAQLREDDVGDLEERLADLETRVEQLERDRQDVATVEERIEEIEREPAAPAPVDEGGGAIEAAADQEASADVDDQEASADVDDQGSDLFPDYDQRPTLPAAEGAPEDVIAFARENEYLNSIAKKPARDELLVRLWMLVREEGRVKAETINSYHDDHDVGLGQATWRDNWVVPELEKFPGIGERGAGSRYWEFEGER